ncbi:adenine phosphoribosyltransferase [Chytriomyces hyalinus]|nr:adenine phosphoribosyltransferase [Chytriomyces hyalinus]
MSGSVLAWLPVGNFPKVVLFVSVLAVYNSIQCFIPALRLTHRIYARKPKEATALAARLMGLWTLTSAAIRIYTAYNMNDPACYNLCMLTYVLVTFSFTTEIFIHKTAPLSSPGVWPALLIATASLTYMIMYRDFYLGPEAIAAAFSRTELGETGPRLIALPRTHQLLLCVAIPDFPKKGILFQDIFPLFQDPLAVETLVTHIVHHLTSSNLAKIDAVVGLDARGFLLGPIIAMRLGCAFVPVRKAGKLPGATTQVAYTKEYGTDYFEMQEGAIKKGQNVIILDDLIATGGSAKAAGELVALNGGKTVEYVFFIELSFLKGRDVLDAPTYAVMTFDD